MPLTVDPVIATGAMSSIAQHALSIDDNDAVLGRCALHVDFRRGVGEIAC